MVKRRGKTGNHAEGEHGPRTRAKIVEQLETSASTNEEAAPARVEEPWEPGDSGKHRLFEGRQQHDDAEKQSERNRLENEE